MDFPANQLPNDEDVHVLPIARGVHAGQISIASLFIRAIGMLLGFSYMAVYTTIDEFHFQIAT